MGKCKNMRVSRVHSSWIIVDSRRDRGILLRSTGSAAKRATCQQSTSKPPLLAFALHLALGEAWRSTGIKRFWSLPAMALECRVKVNYSCSISAMESLVVLAINSTVKPSFLSSLAISLASSILPSILPSSFPSFFASATS